MSADPPASRAKPGARKTPGRAATPRTKASGKTAPAHRKPVNLGPLAHHTGYLVRRAQLAIFSELINAFSEYDIRLAEYSVLITLNASPGATHADVADALGIKRTNFVGLFNRLEQRELVERRVVPTDGRANALYVTPAGKKLLAKLTQIGDQHEARIRSLIGAEGQQQLLKLLAEVARLPELEWPGDN